MEESKKDIIRRFYQEIYNKGDLNNMDEIVSPDY